MAQIALYGAEVPAGEDSRRFARVLLAFAVREAWGWAEVPALARGERGKPFFPDCPERHFNLSHTAGLCLCALSAAGPVGADIERVRPRRAGLPRYVMSDGELAAFDGTWERFYEIWTLKEAYCKFLGGSIFPPDAVPMPPPAPWRTYAGADWRAALCGAGAPEAELRWMDIAGETGPY